MICNPPLQKALAGDYRYCHLVELETETGYVYLTDDESHVQFNGKYYRSGILKQFGSVKHNTGIRIGNIALKLNALDPEVIALGLNNRWMNRRVEIKRLIITEQPIDTLTLFIGLLDKMDIDSAGDLRFNVSSIWADFEKQSGRKTNTASHQKHFPHSDPFYHVPYLDDTIPWGKKGSGVVKSPAQRKPKPPTDDDWADIKRYPDEDVNRAPSEVISSSLSR